MQTAHIGSDDLPSLEETPLLKGFTDTPSSEKETHRLASHVLTTGAIKKHNSISKYNLSKSKWMSLSYYFLKFHQITFKVWKIQRCKKGTELCLPSYED